LPERALRRGIRLATARTFEQDPKYALRLLVDIAIRALSPAISPAGGADPRAPPPVRVLIR
jgi:uncharacterized membrane protein